MPPTQSDPSSHLPLHPADYLILLALVAGDLHGYGILKEVSAASSGDVELDPGNLYRRLRRMLNAAWLQRLPSPPEARDERRRHYRLTELGRAIAAAETARLRRVIDTAAARSLSTEVAR